MNGKEAFRRKLGEALALIDDPIFTASSWCRTPEHNRRVGGVPNSKHLTCEAVDVVGDGASLAQLGRAAQKVGLKVIPYSNHIHIQVR